MIKKNRSVIMCSPALELALGVQESGGETIEKDTETRLEGEFQQLHK